MPAAEPEGGGVPLALLVTLAALGMRAPLSAAGPMVPSLMADLGLGPAVAGLLTTIPVLVFAPAAALAGRLGERLGNRRLAAVCLGAAALAAQLRSWLGPVGLFAGTVLLGAAIGILNVLMPALIKGARSGRTGLVMGLYTAGISLSSALASGLTHALGENLGGWRPALAFWGLPAALALAAWAPSLGGKPGRGVAPAGEGTRRLPLRPLLFLSGYMGLQSFLFFSVVAWFVPVLTGGGFEPGGASALLLLAQLAAIGANLVWPAAVERSRRRWALALTTALVYLAGIALAGLARGRILPAAGGLLLTGIGIGSSLAMALTLITLRGRNPGETARVSVVAHTLGYALAAPGPLFLGAVHGITGTWGLPLLFLAGAAALMGLLGVLACAALKKPLPGAALAAGAAGTYVTGAARDEA